MKRNYSGKNNPFYGKRHSKETKLKMRLKKLEFKEKNGFIVSKEAREKISKANSGENNGFFGKHHTVEARLKMGFWKNKQLPEDIKNKMKLAHKGKHGGNKSNFWKGGISFEPYSTDWTRNLRINIRERDRYTCKICRKKQEENVYPVHHIDYNKKNCNPNNLITLCHSCHSKTNSKRKYWKEYLSKQIQSNY